MRQFLIRRAIATSLTIPLVTFFVFSLILLVPGDPVEVLLGDEGSAEHLQAWRKELKLDRPIYVQYLSWVGNVLQGDLGRSIRTGDSISGELMKRYPVTFQLGLGSILVTLIIAIPIGLYSALRPYSLFDNIGTVFAIAGVALPSFWFAILLVYIFAVTLGWLPAFGYVPPLEDPWGNLQRMVMPVLVGGLAGTAAIMRQVRSAMLEVLHQDYIRTAYAKGLAGRIVLVRHALKNAFIPVVTVLGIQVVGVLEGFTVVEVIFGLPGIGQFAVSSAKALDLPSLQGVLLAFGAIVVVANLTVDVMYSFLDPRVRYS